MTLLNVVTALAAAIIGGLLAPYVTGTRERRAARAAVRDAVHRARYAWFPAESMSSGWTTKHPRIEETIAEIESLAIIAGVACRAVDAYTTALRTAANDAPAHEGSTGGWELEATYDKRLRDATEAFVRGLWHPWLGRLQVTRR